MLMLAVSGVFCNCSFISSLAKVKLNVPAPRALHKSPDAKCVPLEEKYGRNVPFVLAGDSGFLLLSDVLKLYPEKGLDDRKWIFNYRLSRFRRCSENAFGILLMIFGIFGKPINFSPE